MKKITSYLLILSIIITLCPINVKASTKYEDLYKMSKETDLSNCYAEIDINLDTKQITKDNKTTTLNKVFDITKEKETQLLNSPTKLKKYLKKENCNIIQKKDTLTITNPFQTKELIINTNNLVENNAKEIGKSKNKYLLRYDTEEETKEDYERLKQIYGDNIYCNQIYKLCSDTLSSISSKETGLNQLNEQINNYKGTKNEITIGVIDSGIDINTPKIKDKIITNKCKSFSSDPVTKDTLGHGTSASYIIADNTPDNINIIMYKIFDTSNTTSSLWLENAVEQAKNDNVDILNLSLSQVMDDSSGNTSTFDKTDELFKDIYENNGIIVCAAGNKSNISSDKQFPAKSKYTVTVSALDNYKKNGKYPLASFSSKGNCIDFAAFGTNIFTYKNSTTSYNGNGTSFACPIIASEMAILKTFDKSLNKTKATNVLKKFISTDFDKIEKTQEYGYGYTDFTHVSLCNKSESNCNILWHDTLDDKTYTLSFNTECDIKNPDSKTINSDNNFVSNLPELNRTGYDFLGWYDDSNNKITSLWVEQDITLHAKWKIKSYDIYLCIDDDNKSIQKIYCDKPIMEQIPQKEHYKFIGWSLDPSDTNNIYPSTYKVDSNLINAIEQSDAEGYYLSIYAIWEGEECTITRKFEDTENNILAQYGDIYKNFGSIERTGYTFLGWQTEDGKEITFPYTVTGDITVYPIWDKKEYTITYYDSNNIYSTKSVKYQDTAENLKIDNTNDYKFIGWYDENDKLFDFSTPITKNIKLYAKWDKITKYKLTLNANLDNIKNPDSIIKTEFDNKTITELPILNTEGYTFNGWYYASGQEVVLPLVLDQNLTVYADWTINKYKLTFDNSDISFKSLEYNTNYTLPIPTKSHYSFVGWYDDNDNKIDSIIIKKDTTIHAKWNPEKYRVSYDNGFNEDIDYLSHPSLPQQYKKGYIFLGWYDKNNNKIDEDYQIIENINLYAHWESTTKPQCTISFISQMDDIDNPNDIVIEKDTSTKLPKLSKEGYTFIGWFNDNELINEDSIINKDMTLYAHWEKIIIPSYIIHFNTEFSTAPQDIEQEEGTTITLPTLQHSHYNFIGWLYNNSLLENTITIKSNMTLTAKWEEKQKYTITLKDVDIKKYTIYEDETFTLPNPEKEGYTFLGWFNNENKISSIIPTQDIELTAKWQINKYNLKLDDKDIELDYNSTYKLPELSKKGYTFLGWFDQQENKYDTIKITKDIQLTSKFKINKYNVTFIDGNNKYTQLVEYNKDAIPPTINKTGYTYTWDSTYNNITKDKVITAKWVPNKYKIVFVNDFAKYEQEIEYDKETKLDKNKFIKEGYVFSGWLYNNTIYKDEGIINNLVPSGIIEFVAQWTKIQNTTPTIPKYTIKYKEQNNKVKIETYNQNTYLDKLYVPNKNKYIFIGWYINNQKVTNIKINNNITLIAKWEKMPVQVKSIKIKKKRRMVYKKNINEKYEIKYSKYKNMKKSKTLRTNKNKIKIKSNMKYIKIRSYKIINNKKYYSKWSKIFDAPLS